MSPPAGPASRTEAIIRVASRIEREWLAPTRSTIEQKINESGSVTAREIDWYGELILAERPLGMNVDMTAAVLAPHGWSAVPTRTPPAAASDQVRRS